MIMRTVRMIKDQSVHETGDPIGNMPLWYRIISKV